MATLIELRKEVEAIDTLIIGQLAQRQRLSKAIGQFKSQAGIGISDPEREANLFQLYESLETEHGLDSTFVRLLFKQIFAYSRQIQAY